MEKKQLSLRVARWFIHLQDYDYTVEHRSGTQMRHADALSRCPIIIINDDFISTICRAQAQDEELSAIRKVLQSRSNYKDFILKSDVLYKVVNDEELLVIPKGLQAEIIKRAHEKGHFGVRKTKELISKDYYLPKLEEKIQKHIQNCIPCIVTNRKLGKQEGELYPIHKEAEPLHTYHVDHLGPLESTSKNYKHIFVVIDAFTKFCCLYPTKSTSSKEVVTELVQQSVVFGNPVQIISDRGTAFTSDEFGQYCDSQGIKHSTITTGLPRANGQVERLNSVIISVLSNSH